MQSLTKRKKKSEEEKCLHAIELNSVKQREAGKVRDQGRVSLSFWYCPHQQILLAHQKPILTKNSIKQ